VADPLTSIVAENLWNRARNPVRILKVVRGAFWLQKALLQGEFGQQEHSRIPAIRRRHERTDPRRRLDVSTARPFTAGAI